MHLSLCWNDGVRPLITAEELMTLDRNVAVCDLRWDLLDPAKGLADYESGHIPGAVFVDLDADLAAPPGIEGRHPLPNPAKFADTLGRLGISPVTRVVVYDDSGGRIAARLWWMLRSIGHEAVQVLDGGYQAWVANGGEVETGQVVAATTVYPGPIRFTGVVNHDELEGWSIVDARAPERYRGDHEPIDPKPGRIPGAQNIPTDANLGIDGRFLDATRLAEIYGGLPENTLVSCGSGVNACHDALAMVVSGRPMPAVYVGSYSEWSRRDLPVETG